METLLDATYLTEDDKAVIELFYLPKTKSEDKDIREIKDFEPYFYAIPKGTAEALIKEIEGEKFPQIAKLKTVKRTDLNKEISVVEITVKHPRNVPEIRDKIKDLKHCKETREDDIRFVQRYVIDAERPFMMAFVVMPKIDCRIINAARAMKGVPLPDAIGAGGCFDKDIIIPPQKN